MIKPATKNTWKKWGNGRLKLVYSGKTKDVYEDDQGTYTLKLKDDATGKDGVFDPGENTVGLQIAGLGRESLRLTQYFFEMLAKKGVPTHFIECDIEAAAMRVKPAQVFGKGLEFVCRIKAGGSFVKRYGAYLTPGQDLDFLVEVTLKDDDRGDPPITKDSLEALNLMTGEEFETCKGLTRKIAKLMAEDLSAKGLELQDLKFEFGKSGGEILLIDEISGGCMRVSHKGELLHPMDLTKFILK